MLDFESICNVRSLWAVWALVSATLAPAGLGDTPLWLVINSWTSAQGWHAGMLTRSEGIFKKSSNHYAQLDLGVC